jgi:hypothetical protein
LESLIVYPIVGNDRVHLVELRDSAFCGALTRCAVVSLVVDLATADADPPRPIWSFAFFFLRLASLGGGARAEGAARASTSFESSLISL